MYVFQKLYAISLVAWFCSLALPGFAIYSDQRHIPGYEILLLGWMSPMAGNFAWFANIFFLYAVSKLRSGGDPVKSSIAAALLSLDTFRFDRYFLNEGGASTPVYGYGWGAVLWIFSTFMLLAAVGSQQRETREFHNIKGLFEWYQPLGVLLSVVLLSFTAYFATHDRMIANSAEIQHLSGLAFKRGEICRTFEPVVNEPISNFSGPLELVFDSKTANANYPFLQIKELLAWGIPIVRIGDTDYSNEPGIHDWELTSTFASGAASATLYLKESYMHSISAKLIEANTNRTIFDQTWIRENLAVNNDYYCPEYHSFPGMFEQPRQLLIRALSLPAKETKPEERQQRQIFDQVDGTIIQRINTVNNKTIESLRIKETELLNNPRISYSNLNFNCPFEIGWNGRDSDSRQNIGWPFRIKGKSYYLGSLERYNATCDSDSAYIYSGVSRDGKFYLTIQKRTLADFQQLWAGMVVFSGVVPSMIIRSVKPNDKGVIIEFFNDASGESLLIQAPLYDKERG